MTIASVEDSSIRLDSLPLVDLRFLSQSELNSFSLCSHLRRSDDLVVPVIDRSLFNESAGTRKQTYSRLRLPPPKPQTLTPATPATAIRRGRGRPSLSSPRIAAPAAASAPTDDPDRRENSFIVSLLQGMLGKGSKRTATTATTTTTASSISAPTSTIDANFNRVTVNVNAVVKKRLREKECDKYYNKNQNSSRPIHEGSGVGGGVELKNKNGVVVDLSALGTVGDPYGSELKRRTDGVETDEGLLEFLRGLEGQWGSRRRKRKYVDADTFGDALPTGWKILLSLKRKEGRVWLYCRRFVSPNGKQFSSCKEVSAYLLSIFGPQIQSNSSGENHRDTCELASSIITGLAAKDDGKRKDLIEHPPLPITSLLTQHEKEVDLVETEKLEDVQRRDLLECHICNMKFSENVAYLQHLFSVHQKGAKRCRLSTVGDGVIMKDGKYECQFCHKVFLERHRYNGHVGVHVRSYVRSLEASENGAAMQSISDLSSPGGMEAADVNTSSRIEDAPVAPSAATAFNSSDKRNDSSPKDVLDMNTIPETSEKLGIHDEKHSLDCISKMNSGASTPLASEFKDEQSRMPFEISLTDASVGTDNYTMQASVKSNEKPEVDIDAHTTPEPSSANLTNDVTAANSGQNLVISIPQNFTKCEDEHGVMPVEIAKEDGAVHADKTSFLWTSVDESIDKMDAISCSEKDLNSFPKISGVKRGFVLEVGLSHEQDTRACTPQTLAESKDEHNFDYPCDIHFGDGNGNNDSLADESHEKQERGTEMSTFKLDKVDQYHNCVNSELNSSLGSMVASSINDFDRTIEGYDGRETSTNAVQEIGMSLDSSLVSFGNEPFSGAGTGLGGSFSISERNSNLDPAKASQNEPEYDFGTSQASCYKEFLTQNFGSMDNENMILQSMVSDMPSSLVQSSDCFTALNMISEKDQEASNLFNLNHNEKLDNGSGFGGLRLDVVEPISFGLGTGQGPSSLAGGPMDLAYSADLGQGLDASVPFGWEAMLPKMGTSSQVTSVCMWCRTAFTHVNLEKQLDSAGFICPACKAKVSGQLNIFDSGLNLDNF